eukprot:TRINITY_DN8177_c0_g1_i1.p1 TRINITY_DN8177_c0_g1~~TRINITY_DN8177_c0_g1_i1.p1  ORF type:complete len:102 (+),score=4.13 TRINITY_DN8177_c0_g1_i1:56-361(+)
MIFMKSSLVISFSSDAALLSISLNSSVDKFSPSSLETFLRLAKLIVLVLSSSKRSNILFIPSLVSLFPSLLEIASMKSSKSTSPPISSNSQIISYTVGLFF